MSLKTIKKPAWEIGQHWLGDVPKGPLPPPSSPGCGAPICGDDDDDGDGDCHRNGDVKICGDDDDGAPICGDDDD